MDLQLLSEVIRVSRQLDIRILDADPAVFHGSTPQMPILASVSGPRWTLTDPRKVAKAGGFWRMKTRGSVFGFFWKLRLYIYIHNIDVWQGTYGTLQVVQLLVVICFGGYVTSLGIVVMLKGESCLTGMQPAMPIFLKHAAWIVCALGSVWCVSSWFVCNDGAVSSSRRHLKSRSRFEDLLFWNLLCYSMFWTFDCIMMSRSNWFEYACRHCICFWSVCGHSFTNVYCCVFHRLILYTKHLVSRRLHF